MRRLWRKVSSYGVHDKMTIEEKRKVVLLNQISVTLFALLLIFRVIIIATGVDEFSPRIIGGFIISFALLLIPYINKKGYNNISAFSFVLLAPITSTIMPALVQSPGEVIDINLFYYPRILLLAEIVLPLILIHSKKKVLIGIAILINILCLVFYNVIFEKIGLVFTPENTDFSNFHYLTYLILIPAAFLIFAILFLVNLNNKYENEIGFLNSELFDQNKELGQMNEELTQQQEVIMNSHEELTRVKNKLETVNKDFTDSISYAKNIQSAILKETKITEGYFNDSFILFQPKAVVSGDFYFYAPLRIHGKKCIAVIAADCTGHGVPGGFMSMLAISLIQEICNTGNYTYAADILNQLREKIKDSLNQTGKDNEQQDGLDMALCMYYPEEKKVDYAGAKSPLCIISQEEITVVKPDRQPIGIYIDEKDFTSHTIDLKKGDMLYMFSDGIIDQFGGEKGKKLKMKRFTKFLTTISQQECAIQKQNIQEFYASWVADTYEQLDDIVVVGLKI